MDFRLSAEQDMLRDSARRFVANELDWDKRAEKAGSDAGLWGQMAELGWLMLPVPEDGDGLGGTIDDMAIIAEELGGGLAVAPFVEGAVLPSRLIDIAGTNEQRQAILPALAVGAQRIAVALYEPRRGFDLVPGVTRATATEAGYSLSGSKVAVDGGQHADSLIVSALLDGATALFLIDMSASGVQRIDYDTIDERRFSDFLFENVQIEAASLLAADVDGLAAIERAVDEAIVLQCAEALGAIDRAIALTAEYLKVRQQFGQPLAGFQALQHGVANLFIEANDARSITYRAMSMIDAPAAERARAISSCKVKVMEAARSVAGTAIHFHGGIGVTTEYRVGHYLRRALVLDQRFGNGTYHFERLISLAA